MGPITFADKIKGRMFRSKMYPGGELLFKEKSDYLMSGRWKFSRSSMMVNWTVCIERPSSEDEEQTGGITDDPPSMRTSQPST